MSPRAAWRLEALGFDAVFDYVGGKQDWFAAGLPAEGSRRDEDRLGAHVEAAVTCSLDDRVADVLGAIERGPGFAVVVTGPEDVVLGRLPRSDAAEAVRRDGGVLVADVMREGPVTFRPNVGVHEMMHFMREHDLATALVTTSQGVLLGLARRATLERAAGTTDAGRRRA
jgi:hypothetical protein